MILLLRAAMVGVRPNIRIATAQDFRIARYCKAYQYKLLDKAEFPGDLNGFRLFNNSDPLVCTSLIMWSMLKIFSSILDELLTYSFMIHNEFRIFWWEDFI